jgi:hypothetical protein
VVGWCIHETRGRGWGLGQKYETELLWLGFGRAVRNGGGERCVGVGWWCVRGGGGGRVVRSRNARQGMGFGPKIRNRAVVARFQTRRVEWRWRMLRGDGMVVRTRWWW